MMGSMRTSALAAGMRVKVRNPGGVPEWSKWDDDGQRTSNAVKRRLQQLFFRGDRRIAASVVYVSNESLRARLKARKQLKVELRDPAGARIVILADAGNVVAA